MTNIFDYQNYYRDFLSQKGVDLNNCFKLPGVINLSLNAQKLLNIFSNSENKQNKSYKARPFFPQENMFQAVCLSNLGYNDHNTFETNIGLDLNDNLILKSAIGVNNFSLMNLDMHSSLVRLLEYKPGTGIPLHTDSFTAFREKYGSDRQIKRYFVAVSDWDWGHFLQIHDKVIAHWSVGDAYEIPEGTYHLSVNFGIVPKYTLTITGFVDE